MLQSVVPLSVPGSGVPAAASCHSRPVSNRFPDRRHACAAWNQVMQALGRTAPEFEFYTYPGGVHNPLSFPGAIERTRDFLRRLVGGAALATVR